MADSSDHRQFDAAVYEDQIAIMESVLDVEDLIEAVRRVREST